MLSIVIISYNVKSFLRQCVKSVLQSKIKIPIEIIVVDNHSFDNSSQMIKNEFPNVKLIQNTENEGFSKAVNKGVLNSNGDYICLLNPDAIVENKTLDELINYYKNNESTGVIGAKILNPNGTTQLASKRSFPSIWIGISKFFGLNYLFPKSKLFAGYNQTFIQENQIAEVDAISGSCMLFSKKIFDELNGFDESFFLYFEDTDFCSRVINIGKKVIYFPIAKVIHYKGESHKHAPIDTIKIFHESMSIFFKKHKSRFKLWPITWIIIRLGIIAHLFQSYIKFNKAKVLTILLDIIIILGSFIVSIQYWYSYHYKEIINLNLFLKHWPLIFCYLSVWVLTAINFKIYSEKLTSYGRAFASCILTFLISSVFVYYISIIAYSRAVLFLSSFLCGILIPSWRVFAILRFKNRKSSISQFSPLFTRNIAILGTNLESFNMGKILLNSPSIDFNLIGYIEINSTNKSTVIDTEIIGRQSDIYNIIKKYKLNEVIIPEKLYSGDLLFQLFKSMKELNISFKYVSTDDKILVGKGITEEIGPMKLINLEIPLFDKFNLFSKRFFDISLSLVLILTSLPLQLLLYSLTKVNFKLIWSDKNTHLKVYYFHSEFSILRNILMLYSILRGNMTFVGCQQIHVKNDNPNLKFKPGLTGLGHLKSPNSNRDLSVFDEYYIKNQSFLLDLEIIFKSLLKI